MKSIWYGLSTTLLIVSQSPWLWHDSGIEVWSQQQLLTFWRMFLGLIPGLLFGMILRSI